MLDDPDDVYRFRDQARGHLLALHIALGDIDAQAVRRIESD
jgi:hypothetical protein